MNYEIGSADKSRGHAILYYIDENDGAAWACYLTILPIVVDMSKFIPPFLIGMGGETELDMEMSATISPPAPEKFENPDYIRALAKARQDDLIFGGQMDGANMPEMMMSAANALAEYKADYSAANSNLLQSEEQEETAEPGGEYNDIIYSLMSGEDKVRELSSLAGELRRALDLDDRELQETIEENLWALSRQIPFDHNVAKLIQAVKANRTSLATLYIQRCGQLMSEDYLAVSKTESLIDDLELTSNVDDAT